MPQARRRRKNCPSAGGISFELGEENVVWKWHQVAKRIGELINDIKFLENHPKPVDGSFSGMTVKGKVYTERKEAGAEILAVCKAMMNPAPVPLGEYRGFSMDAYFDCNSSEYRVAIKGKITHSTALGNDASGNISRIDNMLESFAQKLEVNRCRLEEVKTQMENAQAEIEKPFAQEAELSEKSARLNEVNIALNLDENDKELVDAVPDEGDVVPRVKKKVMDYEM